MKRLLAASFVALALGACNQQYGSGKSLMPIPPQTMALMSEKGMQKGDAMLVRLYKKEAELEVWKKVDGHYAHLKTFPICRWSGQLGPKTKEGDRQAPEGFYSIAPGQMNPNSQYYLSFDIGFPNAYDRAHSYSGSYLMVHGTCSSRGCYAMTDEGIGELYALARESFSGGQKSFQFQAYPFKMTAENLAKHRQDPHMPFWRNLKEGSDNFEVTKREPKVAVCRGRYTFNGVDDGCKPDPTLAPVIAQKEEQDRQQVAELVAKGVPAIRTVYADGGQNESFRSSSPSYGVDPGSNFAILQTRPSRSLGEVSRPEALAEGPREIAIDAPKASRGPTKVAAAEMAKATATDGAKPGRAKAGRTVVASADPDETPVLATPAPEDKPLYRRLLGKVMGDPEPAKEAAKAEAQAAPAKPEPGQAKRKAASSPPSLAAQPGDKRSKPQASAETARRHASAETALSGAI